MSNLSSNWKKLQGTLQPKPQNPASISGKRKANTEYPVAAKKPKSLSSAKTKAIPRLSAASSVSAKAKTADRPRSKSMGLYTSKPSDDVDTSVTIPSAALEDLSTSQLSLVQTPSSSSLRSFKDSINSGVVPLAIAGKYVAIDCEMVGVGPDPNCSSMLARVSMVNFLGDQVYDSFVAPMEVVTDYRTIVSGITPQLLEGARTFEQVQQDVAALMEGRVLIGHAVHHDLNVLMLGHPKRDVRDTSRHKPYREIANGRTPGLKRLAKEILGVEIQAGEHSSIEDARATMMLYKRDKSNFERGHIRKFGVDRRQIRPDAIDGELVAIKQSKEPGNLKNGKQKKKRRKR